MVADATALRAAIGLFRQAECCLLDSASQGFGGSGHAFDWSLLPGPGHAPCVPVAGTRLVLAGGLDAATVGEAIRRVRPFAVDVSSGIQANSPREKDVGRMEGFVAAVVQADNDRRAVHVATTERNC